MIRCGIYLRLSREDSDDQESNSIQNQRKMIQYYFTLHPEMSLCREWVDDGVSGIHFERNGIQSLFQAVEKKEIDCVVVKDLSRFGRDYIETGYFLQVFFPSHHVRFIAVSDGYDSEKSEFMERNLLVPILNILNDGYCQDISRKVRMQQRIKRLEGAYIGAFCIFGYQKDEKDRNQLQVDEDASVVVRKIFELRCLKKSPEEISNILNVLLILSPYQYKKQKNSTYATSFAKKECTSWSPVAVRRILKNEMYIGTMVQGKQRKINYKLNLRETLPKEEWICVPQKIPAIIKEDVFHRAQIPLKRGRKRL